MPSQHQHTDEHLFAEVSEPNGLEAFRTLYERYKVRIYSYCLHILASRDDADDAFQECWVNVHDRARSGSARVDNVRSYLFRSARNACLMHLRKIRSNVTTEPVVEMPHLGYDPSRDLELQDLIQLGLSFLEPAAREAFILHDAEGFSYEEMAQLLGESVDTLRNRVWRARQQLRTILTPYIGESR